MRSKHPRTARWLSAALSLPLLATVLAGCGDDDATAPDDGSGSSQTTSPEPTAGDAVTIDIVSTADGFDPTTVEVPVGTEVTWTNSDDTVHTATAEDDTWDSGQLDGGEEFSFTPRAAGTYPYVCDIHPSMKGEVVVE